MTMIKTIVHGASGRMGRAVLEACADHEQLEAVAAVSRNASSNRLMTLDEVQTEADVLIDFSLPEGLGRALHWCVERSVALVSGTTGLDADDQRGLAAAAERIPLLWSPNMSLGANLLMRLAAEAARQLPDADIEIVDTHHRYKQDAPSGTALMLGESVAEARGQRLQDQARFERHGRIGARQPGEIGFSVIRAGQVIGDHRVLLSLDGESLELSHSASNRECFAAGAAAAAAWLAGRSPGRYNMQDVLA